jgi:hypothetical protein
LDTVVPAKKKSAKVEITLKSATLPRRRTSKAEIQLGMYMILCYRGTIILCIYHQTVVLVLYSFFVKVYLFVEIMAVVMYHLHIELLLSSKLCGYVCTNIDRAGLRNGLAGQCAQDANLGALRHQWNTQTYVHSQPRLSICEKFSPKIIHI